MQLKNTFCKSPKLKSKWSEGVNIAEKLNVRHCQAMPQCYLFFHSIFYCLSGENKTWCAQNFLWNKKYCSYSKIPQLLDMVTIIR